MSTQRKWTFRYQISAPTQDPFLLIDFINENNALLFDCGVRVWGRVKTILKINHLFITHTHIDHFIGFDHIIRALLGENKTLNIYGPEGISHRIASKLNGYDWDRAADQELILVVNEFSNKKHLKNFHECKHRFQITHSEVHDWEDSVFKAEGISVQACEVDHGGSPCLAYAFKEIDRFRINKEKLNEFGFKPGPWIGKYLEYLKCKPESDKLIDVDGEQFTSEKLKQAFVEIQKGQKISYVTDTGFSEDLLQKISNLSFRSDILFCESTFLEEDVMLAEKYGHLTARQAALIAREAEVKKLVLFHVSSRYYPNIDNAVKEAEKIFPFVELSAQRGKTRKQNFIRRHGME